MSFFVDGQLKRLGLKKEIEYLYTLGKLAGKWDELAGVLPGDSDVEDIFELVLRFDDVRDDIEPILRDAGIDSERVAEIAAEIRKKHGDRIPARAQHLLVPIGEYADLDEEVILHWDLLDLEESRSERVANDELAFDLGLAADARLEIEPGDQPDFRSDELLLRLGFTGEVSGSLTLGAVSHWGPIGAKAGATRNGSLTYWFEIPGHSSHRLIESVARGLGALANPFELRSINDCATASEYRLDRVSFVSKFEVPRELEMRFNIAPRIDVPRIVENEISFVARATRSRLLEVEAYRDNGGLVVRLALSKLRSTQRNAEWSFGIEVGDIASAARDYVSQLSEEISEFKKSYGDVLSPGTWLKENMEEEFGEFLRLGADADEDIKDLMKEIVDEVDGGKRLLGGTLEEIAGRIGGRLKARLPARIADQMEDAFSNLLERLKTAIELRIDEQVQAAINRGEQAAKELFDRVDELQLIVDARVDKLATNADNATTRVRAVLARLEEVVANLTTALEKAATAKLQVRLWHEESIRGGQEAEATVRFSQFDDNTAAVYARLLRGEVSKLRGLLNRSIRGVEIREAEFRQFLDRSTKSGVEISLLGFQFEQTNIFKRGAVITVDKNGHVLVHANASSARKIRSPWAAQQVAFASQFELWSATESGSASLTISATQEYKNLEPHEVEDLLDDLVREELITAHVLDRAKSIVVEKAQSRVKLRATVDLRLAMLERDVEELLRVGGQVGDGGAVIDRVLDVLVQTDVFDRKAISNAARAARGVLPRKVRRELNGSAKDVFRYFQPVPTGHSAQTVARVHRA